MKTKLLPLLFLVVAIYSNAQNVAIPDANFKNYLISNSVINTNGDTEIQVSEAVAFAGEINLSSTGIITNITGIEAFTNLTELKASGKGILSANLTQNIALEILELDRNELTTLDLSQNVNLITVDLERNQLTAIDVTSNTSLENLTIRRNNISILDISQNTALKFLDTSVTLITSVDFSSNTLLETYWTQDSVLSSLDLSQNPNVTYISAYNCNLTSANIANTNNVNMTIVSLDGNPNLTCIQIDAGFTPPSGYSGWSKDVTTSYSDNCPVICNTNVNIPDVNFKNYLINNSAINTNGDSEIQCVEATAFTGVINVSYNNIADLTGIELFTSISELICQGNSLTTLDISHNTMLTNLDASNNQLTSIDVSRNTMLTHLNINTNQLTTIDVSANLLIEVLRIGNNPIMNIDVTNNSALTQLSCGNNMLSSLDVSQNLNLTALSCPFNQLTTLDVTNNTLLETLLCPHNSLTALDISNNTALDWLYCENNNLTTLDTSSNSLLEVLTCQNNSLSALDFSSNTALLSLDCNNNQITSLDLSLNALLISVSVHDNQLLNLNMANGMNTNMQYFDARSNPNLICITVDDVVYSDANWTNIDSQMNFDINCTLSTEEFIQSNFRLYPNPTKNTLYIGANNIFEQVIIYNFLGKEIMRTDLKTINVSNFSNGVYLIQIKSKDGKQITKRFVKQ